MNRFVIVDGLPFLFANGKTYAVRWDDKGFTVGAEVNLASVPSFTYSELSIKAKCKTLDSISNQEQGEDEFGSMKVTELKAFADEHGIDLGEATKKADILDVIRQAVGQDVNVDDSDN